MDDDFTPTRAELHREQVEEWLIVSYEERYRGFCQEHHLDPEDPDSVHAYEEEWKEQMDGDSDEEWRPE